MPRSQRMLAKSWESGIPQQLAQSRLCPRHLSSHARQAAAGLGCTRLTLKRTVLQPIQRIGQPARRHCDLGEPMPRRNGRTYAQSDTEAKDTADAVQLMAAKLARPDLDNACSRPLMNVAAQFKARQLCTHVRRKPCTCKLCAQTCGCPASVRVRLGRACSAERVRTPSALYSVVTSCINARRRSASAVRPSLCRQAGRQSMTHYERQTRARCLPPPSGAAGHAASVHPHPVLLQECVHPPQAAAAATGSLRPAHPCLNATGLCAPARVCPFVTQQRGAGPRRHARAQRGCDEQWARIVRTGIGCGDQWAAIQAGWDGCGADIVITRHQRL